MKKTSFPLLLSLYGIASLGHSLAQSATQIVPKLTSTRAFRLSNQGPSIHHRVQAGQPFTIAGPRGVVLGQQEGTFEAWILPVKLLSHFAIRAEVEGYSVPIDLNAAAASIDVLPDHTTITYSHIAFTVRQTMFAPEATADGTGAVVLFEIDSDRAMDLTFSFTPEMRPMWPLPAPGNPSAEWIPEPGLYLLHTDLPNITGAVTIPGAQPGIMAPYQEKPQVHPLELKLHYDPKRDAGRVFPLLMAVGQSSASASSAALENTLAKLSETLPALYAAHTAQYAKWQHELTSISTPDAAFNDAFTWAAISIEQLRARATTDAGSPGEIGLVAGYFSSGDSARPGFGWYFGRDTLYTLYAVNGFGDFALTRDALDFLIKRQRADGKSDARVFADCRGRRLEVLPLRVRSRRRHPAVPYRHARTMFRPAATSNSSANTAPPSKPPGASKRRTTPTATASTTTPRAPAGSRAGPAACPNRRSTLPCSTSKPRPPCRSSQLCSATTPRASQLPSAPPHSPQRSSRNTSSPPLANMLSVTIPTAPSTRLAPSTPPSPGGMRRRIPAAIR